MKQDWTFRPRWPKEFDTPHFSKIKHAIIDLGIDKVSNLLGITKNEKAILFDKIKKDLFKGNLSIIEISNKYDIGIEQVQNHIETFKLSGYNIQVVADQKIQISKMISKNEPTVIPYNEVRDEYTYRFGAIGDNHIASKYARLDVLNALYDYYEREGIDTVYNTGNWIDGYIERINKFDVTCAGVDDQCNLMLEQYPKREGINTYYVSGDDHEGWYTQREGINVGLHLQHMARDTENPNYREDLHFLGHMEHDIHIQAPEGETVIRVQHPGGGSSYAISYTAQKIVESLQGGEKPHVLLIGHYHKAAYNYVRNVHVIQTGTTQDQTPFMRKKKLAAHLGGWVIEMSTDKYGSVTKFKSEWIPFFDRDFYAKKWEYKW